MNPTIRNNFDLSRFETLVDEHKCVLDYRIDKDIVTIHRVFVPPLVEGQGIAGRLTRHALDWVREKDLKVVPRCPYVAAWIERHPEYQDLVFRT